jgi:hypothetical protein
MELRTLYERVLNNLIHIYKKNEFELLYQEKTGTDALMALIIESSEYIYDKFFRGELTCYVVCFSESQDMLSQWRGYADDSQGFSICISTKNICSYIESNNDFLELSKVEYKTDKELNKLSEDISIEILKELSTLRNFIIEEMCVKNNEIDSLMSFNFNSMIESVIYDSILIKHDSFKEEKEWRLYTKEISSKSFINDYNDDKIYGLLNKTTIKEVKDRISFYVLDNQIKSYVYLNFEDLTIKVNNKCLKEIIIGSKNCTTFKDLELLLSNHGWDNIKIIKSLITYR